MINPEEQALQPDDLTRLAGPVAGQPDEWLVAWLIGLDQAGREQWEGKLIADLRERYSWSALVRMSGIPQTTLWNRLAKWRQLNS